MRIRTVKPEFWQSEELAGVDREVRALAIALLNLADDEGFFRAHPALIAGQVFPFDSDGQKFVTKALPELVRVGFIEVADQIGKIATFEEHQRINRPTPSKLKAKFSTHTLLSEGSLSTHGGLTEESGKLSEGAGKITQEVEREVKLGGLREVSQNLTDPVVIVFEHWKETTDRPKAKLDQKRRDLISDRLKAFDLETLCEAIGGYRNSPYHQGQNERRTKYTDIELFLRDTKHVENGLEFARRPPKQIPNTKGNWRGDVDWEAENAKSDAGGAF